MKPVTARDFLPVSPDDLVGVRGRFNYFAHGGFYMQMSLLQFKVAGSHVPQPDVGRVAARKGHQVIFEAGGLRIYAHVDMGIKIVVGHSSEFPHIPSPAAGIIARKVVVAGSRGMIPLQPDGRIASQEIHAVGVSMQHRYGCRLWSRRACGGSAAVMARALHKSTVLPGTVACIAGTVEVVVNGGEIALVHEGISEAAGSQINVSAGDRGPEPHFLIPLSLVFPESVGLLGKQFLPKGQTSNNPKNAD